MKPGGASAKQERLVGELEFLNPFTNYSLFDFIMELFGCQFTGLDFVSWYGSVFMNAIILDPHIFVGGLELNDF